MRCTMSSGRPCSKTNWVTARRSPTAFRNTRYAESGRHSSCDGPSPIPGPWCVCAFGPDFRRPMITQSGPGLPDPSDEVERADGGLVGLMNRTTAGTSEPGLASGLSYVCLILSRRDPEPDIRPAVVPPIVWWEIQRSRSPGVW